MESIWLIRRKIRSLLIPFTQKMGYLISRKGNPLKPDINPLETEAKPPHGRKKSLFPMRGLSIWKNCRNPRISLPALITFYEFIQEDYTQILTEKKVREKDFDVHNFLNVRNLITGVVNMTTS